MSTRGHIITMPITGLMVRIVKLWRSGQVPSNYQWQMTRLCYDYESRTGERMITVGDVAVLEEWYDSLTEDDISYMDARYE